MNIFIVEQCHKWDGDNILGVFDNADQAVQLAKKYLQEYPTISRKHSCEEIRVNQWVANTEKPYETIYSSNGY